MTNPVHDIKEALVTIKKAQLTPDLVLGKASSFAQSGTATSGLTYYDLEAGAKFLYPVLTPLRNSIPRVSGKGGIQANWRAVTGVNMAGVRGGVSPGNRNSTQTVNVFNYIASYKGLGIETNVDFEATYAGQGFDDVRAIGAKTGLESLMLIEEAMILGGNSGLALGQVGTVAISTATTGGAIAATTVVHVGVVALTLEGYLAASLTGGVQGQFTRTNIDGSTDVINGGSGTASADVTVTTGLGTTNSVTVSWPAVVGAVAYAVFWGATYAGAVLGAIVTVNSAVITTAVGTGTAVAPGVVVLGTAFNADYSRNSLSFDGILSSIFQVNGGSGNTLASGISQTLGSTIYTMATGTAGIGTPLTADGSGGIVEIDAVLKTMWDTYRLGPDTMWVSSQEALNISKKILQGGSTSAQRFVFETDQSMIGGGIMVRTYLNRFSMQGGSVVDIKVHPNMPAGTVLFTSKSLPYPVSGVGNILQIRTRQDYYQIEWPLRSRRYEYGVYADEVLQNYAPFAFACITNIANG